MKLLLKETIRANGQRYMPKTVVDTKVIGITDADADVLVRRGTAVVVVDAVEVSTPEPVAEVQAEEAAPEVIEPQDVPEVAAEEEAPAPKPATRKASKK